MSFLYDYLPLDNNAAKCIKFMKSCIQTVTFYHENSSSYFTFSNVSSVSKKYLAFTTQDAYNIKTLLEWFRIKYFVQQI